MLQRQLQSDWENLRSADLCRRSKYLYRCKFLIRAYITNVVAAAAPTAAAAFAGSWEQQRSSTSSSDQVSSGRSSSDQLSDRSFGSGVEVNFQIDGGNQDRQ